MEISFTHILPPGVLMQSEYHYNKGWHFAKGALLRYGAEACNNMRKHMNQSSSYNRGACDCFDGKPHKYEYGKGNT